MIRTDKWTHRIWRLLALWAAVASVAYLVQKATADYTFRYDWGRGPAAEQRYAAAADDLRLLGKAHLVQVLPAGLSRQQAHEHGLWARYLLAPFLTTGPTSLVLIDRWDNGPAARLAAQKGWRIVKDYGKGLALCRMEAQP